MTMDMSPKEQYEYGEAVSAAVHAPATTEPVCDHTFTTLTPQGIFTATVCFGHFSVAKSDEWLSTHIINERLKNAGYETGTEALTRELVNAAHDNTLEPFQPAPEPVCVRVEHQLKVIGNCGVGDDGNCSEHNDSRGDSAEFPKPEHKGMVYFHGKFQPAESSGGEISQHL